MVQITVLSICSLFFSFQFFFLFVFFCSVFSVPLKFLSPSTSFSCIFFFSGICLLLSSFSFFLLSSLFFYSDFFFNIFYSSSMLFIDVFLVVSINFYNLSPFFSSLIIQIELLVSFVVFLDMVFIIVF